MPDYRTLDRLLVLRLSRRYNGVPTESQLVHVNGPRNTTAD